jgi:hypothetical protein
LDLEGADINESINDAWEARASLVVVRGVGVVAGIDRGTAGQESEGRGGSAIVLQRTENWIDVDKISWIEISAAVSNQVVTQGAKGVINVPTAIRGDIPRNDGVPTLENPAFSTTNPLGNNPTATAADIA